MYQLQKDTVSEIQEAEDKTEEEKHVDNDGTKSTEFDKEDVEEKQMNEEEIQNEKEDILPSIEQNDDETPEPTFEPLDKLEDKEEKQESDEEVESFTAKEVEEKIVTNERVI